MTPTHTFTLPNGLRVILAPSATDVVYAGIAVAAGTRHETDDESGMAHFVEHMSFKGTTKLSSVQILNRMESVGADLNAYTGKEETIYYSAFLRQHLRRAIPLLLDIVFNSTFPQAEMDKEVEVVIDEIESYNDSPSELIYDDFEALLFPDHPLGRSILGQAERLRRYRTADLRSFVRRCYSPSRAVLFVKGNVSAEEITRLTKDPPPCPSLGGRGVDTSAGKNPSSSLTHLTPLPPRVAREKEVDLMSSSPSDRGLTPKPRTDRQGEGASSFFTIHKHTHQAHVMLGTQACAISDPRYIGLCLLNNLLGGPAMNSRLSLALRERTGLVYTVESNLTAYTDTGVWAVYFGCDHSDVPRCLRLVHRELRNLTDRLLPPRTLAAAKRQLKGQIGIAHDNFENVALGMAKRFLHEGYVPSLEETYRQIDDLTPEDLKAIANEMFRPERLTTLIYE